MTVFQAIGIAGTGVTVYRKWLDAVSDNMSNLNTVRRTDEEAFRAKYVIAQAVDYGSGNGGAQVAGIALGNAEGRLTYAPDHPLADAEGYVRLPDMELSDQMSGLIMAQRGFQASVQTTKHAQDTYAAALQIGR